ncbi:MAG: DUF2085 domain-containing protein [Thermoplasmatota archaeon]
MSGKGAVKRSRMRREDLGSKVIDDRSPALKKICHGDPARCFWVSGRPLPLCSRCIFIYPFSLLFLLIGLPIFMTYGIRSYTILVIFIILVIPLVVDGYTQYLGWRSSNNLLRGVTGALSGAGIGLAVAYMIARIIS